MIIAITGKSGSGKDTVENILHNCISETVRDRLGSASQWKFISNSYYKRVKFADKIKDIVCILIGCSRLDLENQEFKTTSIKSINKTPRDLLQLVGTEFGRLLHSNIWVNALFSDYNNNKLFVISDLRFKNELKSVKSKKGIVIGIIRRKHFSEWCKDYNLEYHNADTIKGLYSEYEFALELEQLDSTKPDLVSQIIRKTCHRSETELEDFKEEDIDFKIKNYGSLNELEQSIEKLYKDKIEQKLIEFLNHGKRTNIW